MSLHHRTASPAPSVLASDLAPSFRTTLKWGPDWQQLVSPPAKSRLPQWEAVSDDYVFSLVVNALDKHPALTEGYTLHYAKSVMGILKAHLTGNCKGGK